MCVKKVLLIFSRKSVYKQNYTCIKTFAKLIHFLIHTETNYKVNQIARFFEQV